MRAHLDDDLQGHAKIASVGDAAFRLHMQTLLWCRQRGTDGYITQAVVERYACAGIRGIRTPRQLKKAINELLVAGQPYHEIGLWEQAEGGYQVHDYDQMYPPDAQPALEEVPSAAWPRKKELDRRRAAAYRKRQRDERQTQRDGERHESRDDQRDGVTLPPRPPISEFTSTTTDPSCGRDGERDAQRDDRAAGIVTERGGASRSEELISCPPELVLASRQLSTLGSGLGATPQQLKTLAAGLVASWLVNPTKRMRRASWGAYLAKAVTGEWSAGKRPLDLPTQGPTVEQREATERRLARQRELEEAEVADLNRRASGRLPTGGAGPSLQAVVGGLGK